MSLDGAEQVDRSDDGTREIDKQRVVWRLLDDDCEIDRSSRTRPHWDQFGTLNFVTIHLNDSVPRRVVQRWLSMQREWLESRGLGNERVETFASRTDIPVPLQRAFKKMRREGWENGLDECLGACPLRDRAIAHQVAETLLHFNEVRYDLERFVIMPNHIHALVQMRFPWRIRKQCASWTRYASRRVNRESKSRVLSFAEPFDHLVRNEKQFEYLQRYIQDNPKRARLEPGEYLLWIRGKGFVE